MSPNMSENKTNNTVTCDSCGHSARIHPQLADKYVQPMAEIFKVLGDLTRIKILELLSHEDMCVSNIAEMLDMTHSAISHQLRQLRHAQLVKFSKSGKEVIYSLDDEHVLTLFAQALDHVKHKV
jgi:DNA-binding transcriptional ArsR family regulator